MQQSIIPPTGQSPAPKPLPPIPPDSAIPVTLQNICPTYPQKAWISMGLPKSVAALNDGKNGYAKTADGRVFKTCVRGRELFVQADLKANEKIDVSCFQETAGNVGFQFSEWVIDQPEKILPKFILKTNEGAICESLDMPFWPGFGPKPEAYFKLEEDLDVRKRFFYRTKIPQAPLIIEGWLDVYSNQDVVPIIVRASFGTIASEAVLNKKFGTLSMITGEKAVIDFKKAKGLHDIVWRTDLGAWETELVTPRLWWKSRVIECFGALLCMPPYEDLNKWATKPDFIPRTLTLKAREEAPCMGIANVWEGKWLAFGKVPEMPISGVTEIMNAYNRLMTRVNTYSDEYAKRDYAQPPNSGQTGSQPDFGATRGELALTARNPWALWDYRFSVQAWMLRPYAHKDADGNPVQAKDHPNTLLWGLGLDSRFGSDFLGWPYPIPYNEFWTGSDSQHRSDNLLYAVYNLTRDPSVKATIEDLVQCSLMELKIYKMYPPPIGSVSSPRGWGRPLISLAHLVSLDHPEVLANLTEMVEVMYTGASMQFIPQDATHTVRTLSNDGFKYGWVDVNGNPIRAWVCWEESIGAMGLWAAYKVTGNQKAKYLALEIAKTITRHAFFKATDGKWYACYCVRWDEKDPGKPLPDSAYYLAANPEDNKDVIVYGMQQWMLPALRILASELPNDPVTPRAKEIISFFGNRPGDFNDAAWWAVV